MGFTTENTENTEKRKPSKNLLLSGPAFDAGGLPLPWSDSSISVFSVFSVVIPIRHAICDLRFAICHREAPPSRILRMAGREA
jgi:hypothetical protein